jgi:hypothetical protein
MRLRSHGAIAMILLLGLAGWGCSGGGGNGGDGVDEGSPGAAVMTFFDRLNSGDLPGAKELYTSDAALAVEDPEVFQGWADQVTREGAIDSVSIVSSVVEEGTASVEFELVFNDGTREAHTVTCTMQDGVWKLGPIL